MLYIHRMDSRAQIAFCYTQDENCFPRQCYGEDNNFIKGNSKTNSSRESIYNIDRFFFSNFEILFILQCECFSWTTVISVDSHVASVEMSSGVASQQRLVPACIFHDLSDDCAIKWQSCISKLHPRFLWNYNWVIMVQHYTELSTFSSI